MASKVSANPMADVVSMLERYMDAAQQECVTMPGHESGCECATHRQVREVHDEAVELLARIKGA